MFTYPSSGVDHGKPIQRVRSKEVLLLPLVQAGQDLRQILGRIRPFAAVPGSIVFPVEIPHGVASVLQWLYPSLDACRHDSDHGQAGMSH